MPTSALDVAVGEIPDPDELIRAAMKWHFSADTGSPFWVRRAATLGFDPIADISTHADLLRFPNVTDEIRDIPAKDLIPRGFGDRPDVVAVIESGGTTGAPKRIPLVREFANRLAHSESVLLESTGVSRTRPWLSLFPSGPHGALDQARRSATAYGDGTLVFAIDLDPRWIKQRAAAGDESAVNAYIDHIVNQAANILRLENIALLRLTPPVLARLVEVDEILELITEKVTHITWGGAQMDGATRAFYRDVLLPGVHMRGGYGTTMALGAGGVERAGLSDADPCVFDPNLSPYVTFGVVDPESGETVAFGERGQLVVNHVSKSFFLPNNAERDEVLRVEAPAGFVGDSIANIRALQTFKGAAVVEGVY